MELLQFFFGLFILGVNAALVSCIFWGVAFLFCKFARLID